MIKKTWFADLTLIFVAFIWGATFVIVQNAIAFLPPITFNGVRFFLAAVMLGGWQVLFKREQLAFFNKKLLLSGFILGLWLFFAYATQTIGLLYTSSSKAGFITGLNIVLVPFFTFLILKQRPGRNAIFGVIVAVIGLYLLTMTDISALNNGDALVFLCSIGFAMQIVLTGKYSSRYPTLLLTVVQIGTVSLLSIIYALFFEDWRLALEPSVLFRSDVVIALLVTSVLATAFAFFVQTNFQKYTSPTRVALIFSMEPVFAALTGFIVANERLSLSAIIGCAFILAGMLLAELPVKNINFLKKNKVS